MALLRARPDLPARPITAAVAAGEVHFRESFRLAVAQDGARIGAGNVQGIVDAGLADGNLRRILQAREAVVERNAQRIQQRRLASARGAGYREKPDTR